MIKRHPEYFATLIITFLLLSGCASYHVRQGNRLFNSLAYSDAIVEYQKALGKKDFPQADIGLAESYRLTNNTQKAEEAYAKVMQLKECEPIHRLRYAQLLMRNGKYEMAKTWFDNYLKDQPNDNHAKILKASCDSIEAYKKDSAVYTVTTSPVNSGQTNFSPQYYKDGVVFVSDRASGSGVKTYHWTGQPFLDLYFAKMDKDKNLSTPEPIKGEVNGLYHDGPCAFIGDTVMYLTRNNYIRKKLKKGEADFVNLKLYKSVFKDSTWGKLEEFPYNSNDYSIGHPAITKDGKTMYFVSDMPGGSGGTDLYVTKFDNGSWSQPVNLGTAINTPSNEMFPTIYHDTILYFSSEGHTNMGGLDIFYSINHNGLWTDAKNMKYPINSSNDDFGVILNDSATEGYFSSNRNMGNTMQDNIYGFTKLFFSLDGMAVEKNTQKPISGVLVELTNETTGEKVASITGKDGTFMFLLEQNCKFSIVGSKDNYYTNTEKVSTIDKKVSENMHVKLKLEMEKIVINKPIVLENIYYDLDKWEIRPDAATGLDRLVTIMKENPSIKIELGSHTDSRADDKYNMTLSQKRADAAVNYIVEHGISKDRITAKGYGESMLINKCKDNVQCTEEEHQQNRRTEFKVVGFMNDKKTSLN
jgi:peptidoglycan-associated lipoprotein